MLVREKARCQRHRRRREDDQQDRERDDGAAERLFAARLHLNEKAAAAAATDLSLSSSAIESLTHELGQCREALEVVEEVARNAPQDAVALRAALTHATAVAVPAPMLVPHWYDQGALEPSLPPPLSSPLLSPYR